jgi:hypothetical protein
MACRLAAAVLLVLLGSLGAFAQDADGKLRVHLDCRECFGDFIREAVDLVEYVRDPAEADIHVLVTSSETGSGGVERAVALIGLGRFKGLDFKMRAISQSGDTEDTQRQRLATAITIGLLNYLSHDGVKGGLAVEVEQTAQPGRAPGAADPWNFWVLSVQGSISMSGEESSRELDLSGDIGADRITDDWKITMGAEIEYSREDFDLDEDEPLRAERNERDFDALVAKSLDDHWSVGRRSNTTCSPIRNTRAGSCALATPSALTLPTTAKRRSSSACRIAWPSSRRPSRSTSVSRGGRCRQRSSTRASSHSRRAIASRSKAM